MLRKSLEQEADTLIYDLEDSVAPDSKPSARAELVKFLTNTPSMPSPAQLSIRVNDITTPYFEDDVAALASLPPDIVSTIVVPKVEDRTPLEYIQQNATSSQGWNVVASIESAKALWNIGHIASFISEHVRLVALLFAAEDYCASTSIMRSKSRQELLYARSKLVTAAKAHDLHAIDMVNVNYKDPAYHKIESEDGRALGFNGKQAIHPVQIAGINRAFRPTESEVSRAAKILSQMRVSHQSGTGAFGLEINGKTEMIDAPMVKQAERLLHFAGLCGMAVPKLDNPT